MKRSLLWIAVAAAVAVFPRSALATGVNMFWYGDQMEQTPANQISDFLTTRGGPLDQLTQSMTSYVSHAPTELGLTLYKHGKTWPGYTLLSSIGSGRTILINMNGEVVKTWPLFPFPAKMLPGGFVLGGGSQGLPFHQEMGSLVQMDWDGNVVWAWAPVTGECKDAQGKPTGCARWHHDYQREGNPVGYFSPFMAPKTIGKTLVLSHFNPNPLETLNITEVKDPSGNYAGLEDDMITEVDAQGNVLWRWHAYQHFEQFGFDPVAKQAIKTISVGAPEGIGGGFYGSDWQHFNNINYLGPNKWYDMGDERFHPDNIIFDGRSTNIIGIIARYDSPKNHWKSGDIIWRVGPDYSFPNAEHELGQIIGQHHAHMIPQGLPGAGNILVFDNGGLAGFGSLVPGAKPYWPVTYRNYSRVIEFNPRTMEVVWVYEDVKGAQVPGDRKFFSWYISSAQRLLNGNTMITEGGDGRVFEVTRSGEVVWEYISPFGRGTPGMDNFGNAVYRAYRVPFWWVPCGMFCKPLPPTPPQQ